MTPTEITAAGVVVFMIACVLMWIVRDVQYWNRKCAQEDAHQSKFFEALFTPPWAVKPPLLLPRGKSAMADAAPTADAPADPDAALPFAEEIRPKCTVCRAVVGVGPHGRKLLEQNNLCSGTCLARLFETYFKWEGKDV